MNKRVCDLCTDPEAATDAVVLLTIKYPDKEVIGYRPDLCTFHLDGLQTQLGLAPKQAVSV